MNETVKYLQMYRELKNICQEEILQLILKAETREEKEFFEMIGNFLLQEKQKQVIERDLF